MRKSQLPPLQDCITQEPVICSPTRSHTCSISFSLLARDSLCLSRFGLGLLSQLHSPSYSLLSEPFPSPSSHLDLDLLQSPFGSGPGAPCHTHSSSHSLPLTIYFLPTILLCGAIFLGCNLTVQFSNGKLQNPGNMRFTLYKSNDSTNPRKRSQRILVSAAVASHLHSSGLRRPPGCGWR